MRKVNANVLLGSDSVNQNGLQIDTNQIISISFQAVFGDSSAAGTFKLQMSNDINNDQYQPYDFTVTNWTDIPNASASITSGASAVLTVTQTTYRWMRAVYVASSGGTTNISVNMFGLSV